MKLETREDVKDILAKLYRIENDAEQQANKIEADYKAKIEAETKPFQQQLWKAQAQAKKILEDPKLIPLFAEFKPGDFVKRGSEEWLEVYELSLSSDDDGTVDVILRCYEIKWDGTKHRYPTNIYQSRAVRVDETADKRLLKRIKKRMIERLEGTGVSLI